jgi:hypothetical protein
METSASFEARYAPSLYPTCVGFQVQGDGRLARHLASETAPALSVPESSILFLPLTPVPGHLAPDTWYPAPDTQHLTPGSCSSPPTTAVGSKQNAVGVASSKRAIHNSPFTTHHSQFLYFQQHSRLQRLSTCVFIDIPASPSPFPQRSFVFKNIPAWFCHFLKLLVFPFPIGADILS